MSNFPYQDKDLMVDLHFVKYCLDRGCKINTAFLKFLVEKGFISPIAKLKDSNPKGQYDCYSKYQFYLVKRILEERYQEYYFRTFFSYANDIEKYHRETQEHFKDFDIHYLDVIHPLHIDFFKLFYEIEGEYLDFRKQYVVELQRLSDKGGTSFERLDSAGTLRKRLIKDIQEKYKNTSYKAEKQVIDTFITPLLSKHKQFIKVYGSMQANDSFFKIPEALIVRDFIEDILVVIEWYFDTRNIKFDRLITHLRVGDWCTICGEDFKRTRWSQKTCGSSECTRKYKNQYRREKRKADKSYGRSHKEQETVEVLKRKLEAKERYITYLEERKNGT